MAILKSLRERLAPDHFVPSTAVFPDIQTDAIARDLRLAERGADRGRQNLPAETEDNLDTVEQEIVAKVSELRRKALNRYEEHLQAYESRLLVAQEVKAELKKIEGGSDTNFHMASVRWESTLENEKSRVTNYYNALQRFQDKNEIWRPVYQTWPKMLTFGFVFLMIVLEAGLNAYFFQKANESGWIGGISVALLISTLNVFASLIVGYFSRNVIHISIVRKIFIILIILFYIILAFTFNFGVAHFRDAVEFYLDWYQAATKAPVNLRTSPFALVSIESWLLIGIGLLICGASFWKGWALDDPYPGYSRVYLGLENARNEYADQKSMALDELQELKDIAVEDLKIAQMEIASAVKEAIQALFSKQGLNVQLGVFLEHADQSVDRLLTLYREHNIGARESNPPKHFSKPYAFERIKPSPLPKSASKLSAEKNLKEINAIIDETISAVFTHCRKATDSLPRISDLQNVP